MNGRGYVLVMSLQFFVIGHYQWNYNCKRLFVGIDNGTRTGRGYGTMSDTGPKGPEILVFKIAQS